MTPDLLQQLRDASDLLFKLRLSSHDDPAYVTIYDTSQRLAALANSLECASKEAPEQQEWTNPVIDVRRDWDDPELYSCLCVSCNLVFVGHKRRIICRQCADRNARRERETLEELELHKPAEDYIAWIFKDGCTLSEHERTLVAGNVRGFMSWLLLRNAAPQALDELIALCDRATKEKGT